MDEQADRQAEATRDREAIGRVLAGDVEAFAVLVERYQRPVWALARGVLGDATAAEDVAQEAFVAAFRALDRWDASRGTFATWLFAIARNRALAESARKGPRLVDGLGEAPERMGAPTVAAGECDAVLDAALAGLPAAQRTAFVLAEQVGLTPAEIAVIEDAPAGTIRARLSRARAALRGALAAYLSEEGR